MPSRTAWSIETGDRIPSREYVRWMREVPGLADAVRRLGPLDATDGAEAEPALVASAVEFLLEGLHLQRRLNKDRTGAGAIVPAMTMTRLHSPDPTRPAGPTADRARCDRDRDPGPRGRAGTRRWDGSQRSRTSTPTRSSTRWPTT